MPAYGNSLNPSETTALVRFLTTLRGNDLSPAIDASRHMVLSSGTPGSMHLEIVSGRVYFDLMPPAYRTIFVEWSPPIVLTGTLIVAAPDLHAGMACHSQDAAKSISPAAVSVIPSWSCCYLACDCFPARWICGRLLSAHMVEHLLLMSFAPPLLLLGLSCGSDAARLSASSYRSYSRASDSHKGASATGAHMITSLFAWLAMNLVFLGWHVPAAYDFALEHEHWHEFEHVCFLGTSILFWWPVLQPLAYSRERGGWLHVAVLGDG